MALNPAEASAGTHMNTGDLGPLAWVLDETRKSLEAVTKALRRFVSEAESARGVDLSTIDSGPLRLVRQQLHQVVGALEMVGQDVAAHMVRGMEGVAQQFVQHPEKCTGKAASIVENAGFALIEYLEGQLGENPRPALGLFPQFQEIQQLAGADRIHPADLWPVSWRWVNPATPPALQKLRYDKAVRQRVDHGTLKIMKTADASAAEELCVVSLGLADGETAQHPSIFWKLSSGFFEALGHGLLKPDVYIKRAASRILVQYTALARGERSVSERLAHDLLFFCSQAQSVNEETPTLKAVREAWGLQDNVPVDYQTAVFGLFDPSVLAQARRRIDTLKEAWSGLAGGDMARLKSSVDQFGLVADSLRRLHAHGKPLADAFVHVARHVAKSAAAPSPDLAMEAATAVLFLEASFVDFRPGDTVFAARTRQLADRLEAILHGGAQQPLDSWMEELYRRISDRQTLGTVVSELRVTLGEVEQQLDQFFRNVTDRAPLSTALTQMVQMRGVLLVLGLDQAAQAVMRMRDVVESIMQYEGEDIQQAHAQDFGRLGNSLGALGFLIDMLSYQPVLAKKLFTLDEQTGELRPVMGRAEPDLSAQSAEEAQPPASGDGGVHSAISDLLDDARISSGNAPHTLPGQLEQIAISAALDDKTALANAAKEAARAARANDAEGLKGAMDKLSTLVNPAPAPVAAPVAEEPQVDDDLLDIFLEEAREVIQNGQQAIQALEQRSDDMEQQTTLRRAYHTLKGSSRMVGLNEFGEAAWAMEQLMNAWLAEQKPASAELRALAAESMLAFGNWVQAIADKQSAHWQAGPFRISADAMRTGQGHIPLPALPVAISPAAEQAPSPEEEVIDVIAEEKTSSSAETRSETPAQPESGQGIELAIADDTPASEQPVATQGIPDIELPDLALSDLGGGTAAQPEGEARQPQKADAQEPEWPEAVEPTGEKQGASETDLAIFEPAADETVGSEAIEVGAAQPDLELEEAFSSQGQGTPETELPPVNDFAPETLIAVEETGDFDLSDFGFVEVAPEIKPAAEDRDAAEPDVLPPQRQGTPETELPPVNDFAPETLIAVEETGDFDLSDFGFVEVAPEIKPAAEDRDAAEPDVLPPQRQGTPETELPPVEDFAPDTLTAVEETGDFDLSDFGFVEETHETRSAGHEGDAAPAPEAEPEIAPQVEQPVAAVSSQADSQEPVNEDDLPVTIGHLSISRPLYNVYLSEAEPWSRSLSDELAAWASHSGQTMPERAIACAHSLAGASATVGFDSLSAFARAAEHAMQRLHGQLQGSAHQARVLQAAADEIARVLHQFASGALQEPDAALLADINGLEPEGQTTIALPAETLPAALPDPVEEAPAPAAFVSPVAPAPAKSHAPAVFSYVPERVVPAASTASRTTVQITDAPTHPVADGIDVQDAIDEDLFPIFEEEAEELLPRLGEALREWTDSPTDASIRARVQRSLHTLKGSARLAGALVLGEMAHRTESAIEQLGAVEDLKQADVAPLLEYLDELENTFTRLQARAAGEAYEPQAHQQPRPAAAAAPAAAPAAPAAPVASAVPAAPAPAAAADKPKAVAPAVAAPAAAALVPAASGKVAPPVPLSLTASRSAANQAVRVRSQLLDRLVNQAGEVMTSRVRLEAALGLLRNSLGDLTGNLDRLRQQLRDVELQAETQMQSRLALTKDSQQNFDPLEFDRFTRMQELTRMMAESVNDVATVQRTLQRALDSSEDDLVAQARQSRELQRDLLRTRMVEFEGISERLYRVVRQAAKETGKSVKLEITGGSIEMDRGILDRMTPAFEHLLRNCVVHGIEQAAVRASRGKEATGTISIDVSQSGNDVSVAFHDDGGGLDAARICARAVERGLIKAGQQLSNEEIASLIFAPGFTTMSQVTELAGRGVGMDVVRTEIQALGGRIETTFAEGKGSTFRLVMPLTTAVTHVAMVRAGALSIGLPSNQVDIIHRTGPEVLDEAYKNGIFMHEGQALHFYWAGALLQNSPRSTEPPSRSMPVVIIRSADQCIAVHVDEVLGNQEVVVKGLGRQLSRLPGLVAVTALASGAVALIYNLVALATVYGAQAKAFSASGADDSKKASAQSSIPLVLVVDDSITVRRVTQRLLQREGYRVALAADGLQGLERLREERPAVVLSDIEMPRMDGFDFVRNIRSDDKLRDLPVIMITSRIAEKHRDHAEELGVNHYLGKPYSEEDLLRLIREYAMATNAAEAN